MAASRHDPDSLGERIAAAKAKHEEKDRPKPRASMKGYGTGMKMVLDLVGGCLVGLVFGLAIDQFFNTAPWGLLIMLMLGIASGFRLMMRTASTYAVSSEQETQQPDPEGGDGEQGQTRP